MTGVQTCALPISTTDYGFKKLFGEEANKDLLTDFLNSILPPHHQISGLTFQKTEQLPDHEEGRKTIYDLLCTDKNGETFVVEMQKSPMTYLMDRVTYYATFPIQYQAPKGKWNFKLNPVYVIGILDFEYDTNLKHWKKRRLLRSFSLRDDQGVQMTDNLHFIFLQLPFFTKEIHELETRFDKWCYFLKNLETMDSIPTILKEPIFEKAFDVASMSNMEKNDYILYQISKNKKYELEIVTDEARAEGKIEGKIEGKAEERAKSILNIHSNGYAPSQISELLKIPILEVVEVLKNHGLMDIN